MTAASSTARTELMLRPAQLSPARVAAANAVLLLVLCAGAGSAPLAGVLLAIVAAIGGMSAARPGVRRQLDRCMRNRVVARRERRRRRALASTSLLREQQYRELRELVHQIERVDPDEARRLELQELLDYFVDAVVAHQGCLDSRRLVSRRDPTGPCDPARSRSRLELVARRRRFDDECMRRAVRLADEIDAVDELVRLIAQRVWWPRLPDTEGAIDRRLSELDETDGAWTPDEKFGCH